MPMIDKNGSSSSTTVSTMTGSSSSGAGTKGLVPAPEAGNQGMFLKGDATWGYPYYLGSYQNPYYMCGSAALRATEDVARDLGTSSYRFENLHVVNVQNASGDLTLSANSGANSILIRGLDSGEELESNTNIGYSENDYKNGISVDATSTATLASFDIPAGHWLSFPSFCVSSGAETGVYYGAILGTSETVAFGLSRNGKYIGSFVKGDSSHAEGAPIPTRRWVLSEETTLYIVAYNGSSDAVDFYYNITFVRYA